MGNLPGSTLGFPAYVAYGLVMIVAYARNPTKSIGSWAARLLGQHYLTFPRP